MPGRTFLQPVVHVYVNSFHVDKKIDLLLHMQKGIYPSLKKSNAKLYFIAVCCIWEHDESTMQLKRYKDYKEVAAK